MKTEENENISNKNNGIRLKACREYRGMTQETLAEKVDKSTNYISMLEMGKRKIDWDKALMFANVLNVSPAFIMCESDIMLAHQNIPTLDIDSFGAIDTYFIKFLISAGHKIIFYVINLYDGKIPANNYLNYNLDSIHINASIDDLKDFCLSDIHCKLQTANTTSEAIIHKVSIDGHIMPFGAFVYTVNRLYDYIHFTINGLKHFEEDYYLQQAQDSIIGEEAAQSRHELYGNDNPLERALSLVSALNEKYGKGTAELKLDSEE